MMKYFCDACGVEIEQPVTSIERRLGRVTVKVTRAVDRVWNAGEVCIDCLLLVVATGVVR